MFQPKYTTDCKGIAKVDMKTLHEWYHRADNTYQTLSMIPLATMGKIDEVHWLDTGISAEETQE